MRRGILVLMLGSLALLAGCNSQIGRVEDSISGKPVIVIVHGAWGGGWAFREVEDLLRAEGYRVYRPTLTGQGERVHLATLDVGLDTHIQDVVNVIRFEELDDFVLVGHSYGGMVVTGVADRLGGRIRHLIYLDAILPEDGESVLSNGVRKETPRWLPENAGGFIVPPWVPADKAPPKDVPHPLKTFTDPIELDNPQRMAIPTDYILTVDPGKEPGGDDFFGYSQRAGQYGWPVHVLEADHNPQWSKPRELVEMLTGIVGR